jgi:hypothetical protein
LSNISESHSASSPIWPEEKKIKHVIKFEKKKTVVNLNITVKNVTNPLQTAATTQIPA